MDWIEPIVYLAFLSWLDSQSNPSYNPSPFVAQVAWMYQVRWRSADNPSFSVISVGDIALGRSCWGKNDSNLIIYLSMRITNSWMHWNVQYANLVRNKKAFFESSSSNQRLQIGPSKTPFRTEWVYFTKIHWHWFYSKQNQSALNSLQDVDIILHGLSSIFRSRCTIYEFKTSRSLSEIA